MLLDAGADVNAATLGPNGGNTMGLLVTSKQASDADVVGPLIDLLLEYGARLDLTSDDCLDGSLANHAPRAAEKMIALGAKPDVLAAAALGRMDLLRCILRHRRAAAVVPAPARQRDGRARRHRAGAALRLRARASAEAVDFLLEKDGNWNMIGVNNGTALHRAAWQAISAWCSGSSQSGADTSNREQSVQLDAALMGRAQPPGRGRSVDADALPRSTCTMPSASIFRSTSRLGCTRIPRPSTSASTTGTFRRAPRCTGRQAWDMKSAAALLLDNGADREHRRRQRA